MNILEQACIDAEEQSKTEPFYKLDSIFIKARKELISLDKEEEAKMAQCEINCLNFILGEDGLSGSHSGTDEDGKPYEFPSLNDFTNEDIEYLREREKTTKSIYFKTRYSHILWLLTKEFKYAKTVIDSYLQLVYNCKQVDNEEHNYYWSDSVEYYLQNALLISVSTKYKLDKVKNKIICVVKSLYYDNEDSDFLKHKLIGVMLERKKLFRKDDFSGLVDICEKIMLRDTEMNAFTKEEWLNTIISIERHLGNDTRQYKVKIAEIWDNESVRRKDPNSFIPASFCKKALEIYKSLGYKEKVTELELRFDEYKKLIKLDDLSFSFNATQTLEQVDKISEELTNKEAKVLICFLMTDKGLLPPISSVMELNKNIFPPYANLTVYDKNGNDIQHCKNKEEHKRQNMLINYKLYLKCGCNALIFAIFSKGIQKGKLNTINLLTFLAEHSWLGKKLEMSTLGSEKESYRWLAMIAPAIDNYFSNMELFIKSNEYVPNLILCIDSLALKLEGMLRDMCTFNKIKTFKIKKDKNGTSISLERDIQELLHDKDVEKLINPDDLFFFKFLLIEKSGYGLRHKVAHSLMSYYEYNFELAHLLIIALLRFGKYDFVDKTKEDTRS